MRRVPLGIDVFGVTFVVVMALAGGSCGRPGGLHDDGAAPPTGAGGATGADAGAAEADATDATPADGQGAAFDPGWVGVRRLSDGEYARSIQDVLGLSGLDQAIVASFTALPDPAAAVLDRFDNADTAGPISEGRYEIYFSNAVALVQQALADDNLRAGIITCAPAAPTDDACTRTILRAFGLRAWRRPLTDAEVDDLAGLVAVSAGAGARFDDAIAQALTAMLASESFLYRIEIDPPPPGARVHPLTPYELASRLSYLLWSTGPDAPLFALAANGTLSSADTLAAQVARMLADARADGFVTNFFGQWLGFRALDRGSLARTDATWAPDVQASVAEEAHLFVADFLQRDQGIGDLLTANVNFVDPFLANLYGLSTVVPAQMFTRLMNATDVREGYLGLAALLALTSEASASSPIDRGVWVVQQLLCSPVPGPPGGAVLPLPAGPPGTPREQYQQRASSPSCASCHEIFEPLGLGLESFDELGRFRTAYAGDPSTPIDDHGALPDGTVFEGVTGLADVLAKSPQFVACARHELLTYALGRALTDADAAHVAAIDARWQQAGLTMRGLLTAIVVDDLFGTRRAEDAP